MCERKRERVCVCVCVWRGAEEGGEREKRGTSDAAHFLSPWEL